MWVCSCFSPGWFASWIQNFLGIIYEPSDKNWCINFC